MKEILNFLRKALKLKGVKRRGWVKAGVRNPESVADHTYGLALLSMVFGDLEGLNVEKLLRLALIHDLEEAVVGDLTPEEKEGIPGLRGLEEGAVRRLLSSLPEGLRRRYYELWLEYKDGSSREAKLVKQLDRAEMLLQALIYELEGFDPKKLQSFWASPGRGLEGGVERLVRALEEAKRS